MKFDLLGPPTVRENGRTVHAGGPMHQLVLAILLTDPAFISTDALIDLLWPHDDPDATVPRDPRARVHEVVSDLRRSLRDPGRVCGDVLPSRRNGYQACVEREQVDLLRFQDLRRAARANQDAGNLDVAVQQYRDAFRQWGSEAGPSAAEPYAGLAGRWVRNQRERLRSAYLTDLLACIDIEIQLGRHRRIVPELVSLNISYPIDEQIARLLMLAHHGSGQTGESLRAYTRIREKLAEELGTEPGAPLQELQRKILRQDQGISLPEESGPPFRRGKIMSDRNSNIVKGIVVGPLIQASEFNGDAHFGTPASAAAPAAAAVHRFRRLVRAAQREGVLPVSTADAVNFELARALSGDDFADVMGGIRQLLDGAPDLVAHVDEMVDLARRGAL